MSELYLSVILVGRNDNYGGDFKERLQMCVNDAFKNLTHHKIASEIIFVNYNPLDSEKAIQDFIRWPSSSDIVKVKVISVANEYHKKVVNNGNVKDVPVLEYIAKNIGIRRAIGKYFLLLNPDIVIPQSIYKVLKQQTLQETSYYRVDRVDHKAQLNQNTNHFYEIEKSAFNVYLKGFQYQINGYSKSKLGLLRAFNQFRIFFHLNVIVWLSWLFLIIGWKPNPHNAEFRYHCNVSGDFMLMCRDKWFDLKAYPENKFMSLHTDALFVVMAACSGLKEVIFNDPIFHKDHERRYDASNKDESEFRKVYLNFQKSAQEMISKQQPLISNNDSWGMRDVQLPTWVSK